MAISMVNVEPLPDCNELAPDPFEAACRLHYPGLVRLAFLLCGDHRKAEDAVADSLAKVYERSQRHVIDDVGAYARRAVVNQLRGGLRRRVLERREEARHHGDDRGARAFDDAVADHHLLQQALATLAPRQRAAIVLRYYEGLSEAQTATTLGISVGGVKSQVSRGLTKLRAALSEEER